MKKKIRRYRWLIVGICLLASCLIIGSILINKILPAKIKSQLNSIDPRIKIDMASIRASILNSTIHLYDVTIQILPDTNHFITSPVVHFANIELNGIGFLNLLFRRKMMIRKIDLENGNIILDKELLTAKGRNQFNYLSKINFPFEEVSIGKLNVSKSGIRVYSGKDTSLSLFLKASVDGISLGKYAKDSADSKPPFASFLCTLSEIRYSIPESAHTLRIATVSFGSQQEDWRADTLSIIPRFGKYEFARKIGHQTDRIDALVSSIHILKPDWQKLFDKKIVADQIVIGHMRLNIFRDRRIAMKEEKKPMPASYFKNIPFDMNVRQLRLSPSFVTYEEFPKDGTESGTLKIENLQTKIAPLISAASSSHDHIDMAVDGAVMGSGAVHADVYLPLRENKPYEVTGSFTDLSLTSLNESAENLGGFHIESGLLNHLFFKFSMTEEKSTGEIVGEYHELVIDKLKKKSNGEKSKDKFKSFLLQTLVIPRNKDKSMPVGRRTGKVDYKRDPNRYFSHYMLHSLLSGVKASFSLGFVLPG